MQVILSILCIIGLFYIFIFFKRKKEFTNYNKIINQLDIEMKKNKEKIEQNNKLLKELDEKKKKAESQK